ncbi:MAG: glycogen/starch synthase [Candidatus Margulisiibacteriota bacterium]
MPGAIVNPSSNRCSQPRLRVVHVATQAVPFVRGRGLSEVAGRTPAAQTALEIDASLVLPLFKVTRKFVEGNGLQLEEKFSINVQVSSEPVEMKILTTASPVEPGYPVYFVENDALFGHDQMYGWDNDLARFSLFCRAAVKLQRKLGSAPDIFECHDWQTALIPLHLGRILEEQKSQHPPSDEFFADTRSILAVHHFGAGGDFLPLVSHQAGMGWESLHSLPGYLEFYGRINLLKAGLHWAHRSYAASQEFIQEIIDGKYETGFSGIARERLESGSLVGLFPAGNPVQEYTPEIALEGAKRRLSLYRSVLGCPFPGMEDAIQTHPSLTYIVLTPPEKLGEVNETAGDLYEKLDEDDRGLIDREILAGRGERFAAVSGKEELDDLIKFLRLEPACDFEAKMRDEGLRQFLDFFYPGDIDRVLSIPVMLAGKKATLYEHVANYGKQSGGSLLQHLLNHFKSLNLIATAAEKSEKELARELEGRGEFIGEESLASATSDFRRFSEIFNSFLTTANRGLIRAFLIAELLHDMGQLVDFETHPTEGVKLFGKLKEIKGILNDKEREFASHLIRNHSVFGDIVVIWEQKIGDLFRLFSLYEDRAWRDLAVKCCYLISIADMNSIGERGKLTPYDLRRVRDVFNAIIFSRDIEELTKKLELLGLGRDSGRNRWRNFVVGKVKGNVPAERRENRKRNIIIGEEELRAYCTKKVKSADENKELMRKIERTKSARKKERLELQLEQKIRERMDKYYDQLKYIGHVWNMLTFKYVFDARLRARLLIWLCEYHLNRPSLKNFSFRFTKKKEQELAKLRALLEEHDLDKINEAFEYEYRDSQEQLSISVRL